MTKSRSNATAPNAKGTLVVGNGTDASTTLAVASTAGYVLTVDSAQATGLKWAAASSGGMTQLATGTLASAIEGASITSISGSYNHLQLFVYGYQFSQDGYLAFRLNNDATTNVYSRGHWDFDNSGNPQSYNYSGATNIGLNSNYPANLNGVGYVACLDIFNYSSTAMYKHFRLTGSDESNSGSPLVSRNVIGRWLSTAAITSIQIRTEGTPTTFTAGSYILYGVK